MVVGALCALVACGDGSSNGVDSVVATTTPVVVETSTSSPPPTPAATTPPTPAHLTWDYGPVVMSSEDLDFQPVDPEAVVLADGRIRLFVDGIGQASIRSFTSADGVNFVADSFAPIDGTFPSVVALPDGGYRMYVTRLAEVSGDIELDPANGSRVYSLYSPDAETWVEEEGIRAIGYESSAVVLGDGRTLLAVRRDSGETPDPIWCNSPEVTSVWFAVSDDGLAFTDVGEIVDGVKNAELEGRAYGVEFVRTLDGGLVVHVEGCLPAFFASVDESTLSIGELEESPLRGQAVYDEYGFTENIGGAGGDITVVTVDGRLLAYFALRDGSNSMMTEPDGQTIGGVRQRLALATSDP
jgi:hypothetical protein